MGRIEKSIEIKASPERGWEMLALDRLPEWMDVLEMKSSNEENSLNANTNLAALVLNGYGSKVNTSRL